jgi:hypothetical protein
VRCKHNTVNLRWMWFGKLLDHRPRMCNDEHAAEVCDDCGHWLSLGPAKDESEAVRIEIAAATYAARHAPASLIEADEYEWPSHQPDDCDVCNAHHLARVIATHDDTSKEG